MTRKSFYMSLVAVFLIIFSSTQVIAEDDDEEKDLLVSLLKQDVMRQQPRVGNYIVYCNHHDDASVASAIEALSLHVNYDYSNYLNKGFKLRVESLRLKDGIIVTLWIEHRPDQPAEAFTLFESPW